MADDQRNIKVEQSADGSAVVSGDHNHIDQSRTVNIHYHLPEKQPTPNRNDRNETILIKAVWAEVQDRLNQSLHNAVLLTLGKTEQRDQVGRPWDSQLRIANQASRPLPTETPIAEVFDRDDINGKLLILGNPGAGKTTTLLDLAAALVQRANGDPSQPIPVLFNLSSWKDDKQTLKDWLLGELKLKYGVSPKLGEKWLEAQILLPLLDGLDELPPPRQEPAVQRINDWLQSGEGASQLVVCSRREEYELYATKLSLNGAICLEPLTEAQLTTYFAALGMEPLWDTVRQDPDFLELVRTPLLLSVSILANEAIDPAQWQCLTTPQERLDYLLDAYIQRQLHAPIASRTYPPQKQPTPQQTRHWLTWLAQQLQAQSEDEFLIEKMQPHLLGQEKINQQYLKKYAVVHYLTTLGIPALLTQSMIDQLNYRFYEDYIGFGINHPIPGFSLIILLIVPFLIYIGFLDYISLISLVKVFLNKSWLSDSERLIGGSPRKIDCLDSIEWSWNLFFESLPFGILFGAAYGLLFFFESKLAALFILIFHVLILGVKTGFLRKEVSVKQEPNQSIMVMNKYSLTIIFAACVSFSLPILTLTREMSYSLIGLYLGLAIGILISAWYGILDCIKHFILRLMLYEETCIPWNYARFLNYCTERLLLQRVGGRYRFIHRLVQERFAATGGHRL
ncbi:MAG: NACHT domain-containing protein [Spirulina sp.]